MMLLESHNYKVSIARIADCIVCLRRPDHIQLLQIIFTAPDN